MRLRLGEYGSYHVHDERRTKSVSKSGEQTARLKKDRSKHMVSRANAKKLKDDLTEPSSINSSNATNANVLKCQTSHLTALTMLNHHPLQTPAFAQDPPTSWT